MTFHQTYREINENAVKVIESKTNQSDKDTIWARRRKSPHRLENVVWFKRQRGSLRSFTLLRQVYMQPV